MSERTLVLLKPDTVRRGLVGEVLSRFEAKGLNIVRMELRTIDGEVADQHYAEHVERDFYPPLREFVTSGPMLAAVLEGDEAIEVVRAINGATDGR
ncbi:MAG: nucleoside-diphosphate kinase, partial [Nocardioides sp.]